MPFSNLLRESNRNISVRIKHFFFYVESKPIVCNDESQQQHLGNDLSNINSTTTNETSPKLSNTSSWFKNERGDIT